MHSNAGAPRRRRRHATPRNATPRCRTRFVAGCRSLTRLPGQEPRWPPTPPLAQQQACCLLRWCIRGRCAAAASLQHAVRTSTQHADMCARPRARSLRLCGWLLTWAPAATASLAPVRQLQLACRGIVRPGALLSSSRALIGASLPATAAACLCGCLQARWLPGCRRRAPAGRCPAIKGLAWR